jgi:NADH-quinone oxidoreductase subunit N
MLAPLMIPLAVGAVALAVFLADMAVSKDDRSGLGVLTAMGLVGVFGLTFMAPEGQVFDGAYSQDAFTLYVQRILLIAGIIAALGSIGHGAKHFPGRMGEYTLMLLFSLMGMLVLPGARELVTIVVAFELMGIPLYVMAAMHKDRPEGVEGAWKLYLSGAVSSAIVLYGLSFIVGSTNTTMLAELAQARPAPLTVLGAMLMIGGMGFKLGAVPFHMWVPDTYEGAPTPFVAFLSVAPKAAGLAVMARVLMEGFGHMRLTWWPALLVVCVATMVVGNLSAIPQKNVKRMLAYSGIAHMGLLLLAFGIATHDGMAAMLFYLMAYVFMNMGAFLVAEVVAQSGSDDLSAWAGLHKRAPALALAMLMFLLSLGGIPFVAGFWAKVFLFMAAWRSGMTGLVILGAMLSVVALFYYMTIGRSIYIADPAEDAGPLTLSRSMVVAIGLCIAGILVMGVAPNTFYTGAQAAAAVVIGQ